MVRTDSSGIAVWNQTYGGSDYESGKAIAECENGDLIFTGSSRSYGSASLWVVRTTSTGNVLWNQTYGSDWDTGNSISNTADGGFVIGGHKSQNMDALAVRVNSLGDLLWTFDWGGVDVENCKTIIGCNEGDFLLVGRKTGTSVSDLDQLMLRIPDFPFWDEVPIDQMVASADPYSHDYNATLTHGLNTWWLESSPAFTINSSTGVVTNPSPLPEGDLPLVVGVTDLLGNWIKASLTITAYGDTPPVEVDDPIYIGQESDFVSYGFPGDGSSGNPYRIEDKVFWLNVTDWASRMISIVNTRSHFIIENCSFQGKNELQEIGSPTEWMWFGGIGVELWNVSNGVVRDCSFYIVSHGVFLITSSHITVEDCEMHNPLFDMPQPQGIGVQIDDASTRNIVVNNRLTSIGEGVFVANSTYNVIHLNVITVATTDTVEYS